MFSFFSKSRPESISVDELKEKLGKNDGALFVDVREKDEWEEGHIPGFRHVPLSELELYAKDIEGKPEIYLLCHSGGRSGRGCQMLAAEGKEKIFNIAGGWNEWVARGYPIEE